MEEIIVKQDTALAEMIAQAFGCKKADAAQLSPLVLAYIGDGFYEIIIRSFVVMQGDRQVNKLHKESASMVKAAKQAELIKKLQPLLSESELSIYRRGRNTHSHSMAKNASMSDYRHATGFEALMGYLYLTDQTERAIELIKLGMNDGPGNEVEADA